jgi:hypothetical protein
MAVLVVLFTAWFMFRGMGVLGLAPFDTWRQAAVFALAIMFVFTAIAHFNTTKHDLARMVPTVFPRPLALIYVTGVLEFWALPDYCLHSFAGLRRGA